MAKLTWDTSGQRFYETGVSKGVLYVQNSDGTYADGVAWNGLTAVTESPSGAETTSLYADNIKYLDLLSAEELGGTIEAYTYPDAWAACDGSAAMTAVPGMVIGQQGRTSFGLCFVTNVGNDTNGNSFGYKIHLIYGCKASPSERAYSTINDSPEAITFSWEFKSTPVKATISGTEYTLSCITIDSTKFTTSEQKAKLAALEDKLFGTDGVSPQSGTDPELPLPAVVYSTLTT